ncbi:MAG TPA: hypothetical protein VF074_00605 [Pyrinomonadaceae bacterium]
MRSPRETIAQEVRQQFRPLFAKLPINPPELEDVDWTITRTVEPPLVSMTLRRSGEILLLVVCSEWPLTRFLLEIKKAEQSERSTATVIRRLKGRGRRIKFLTPGGFLG